MGKLEALKDSMDEEDDEEVGESEEADVIENLRESGSGKRYEDTSFPASKSALYRSSTIVPEYDMGVGEIKWMRPHELARDPTYFNDGSAGAGNVVKGRLDDAWLLGAMAAVAAHPSNLIENLFTSEPGDFNNYGIYTCRFYINGEWQEIVTDTRLPCTPLPPGAEPPAGAACGHVPLYGRGVDINEFWVPLLEKAYAKLHGTYEALSGGSVGEALVDLTGGSTARICLEEARVEAMVGDGRLWDRLRRYLRWQYILAAGVPLNAACSLVGLREVSGFRLVRVRSPWGAAAAWTGDWSDASPRWEDYPEVLAAISAGGSSAQLGGGGGGGGGGVDAVGGGPWRRDGGDGTFWMAWEDFVARFTHVYVCRVFPDGAGFRQYCVHGEWAGDAMGLAAAPAAAAARSGGGGDAVAESLRRTTMVDVQPDGDPFWFNNPQYRLTVDKPTEVLISLMQQDRRSASYLRENHGVGFEVLRARRRGGSGAAAAAAPHARVWERRAEDVVTDSARASFAPARPEREVAKAGVTLDPRLAYVVVPTCAELGREGKFTLRVFAQSDVVMEPVPETHTLYLRGTWDRTSERDTAGGPLRLPEEAPSGSGGGGGGGGKEGRGVRNNPKWCQNPQFWLRIPDGAAYDSVDVKLVLRRVADGPGGGGGGARGGKPPKVRARAGVARQHCAAEHHLIAGFLCRARASAAQLV
ncbi:hypothetical protein JKP88DRAFT_175932 [Tribonema minus]|uniref:Calpain catalytic domain-containing protein n=1 Tax=Tribonema minus TaxID=303371 RepID=A0A836CKR5_9STRA|nr:hypothetical protein JKP88DRAFT_175932 [Tribonema minus]